MAAPIYLVHLSGLDDANRGAAITVRASTGPYHRASWQYRARIVDLDILWQMEPGFAQTYNNRGTIRLANADGRLDDWSHIRFQTCTVRRGDPDQDYSTARFPTVFQGPVYDLQVSAEHIDITVADRLFAINRPITAPELKSTVYSGRGTPGTVCRGWLTYGDPDPSGFSTGLGSGDIERAGFDEIDREYPSPLAVDLNVLTGEFNYLDALDNALNGLPYALTVTRQGKIRAAQFRRIPPEIDPATPRRVLHPIGAPRIERIWPVGEVATSIAQVDDRGTEEVPVQESAAIKNAWPRVWRKLDTGRLYPSHSTDAARVDWARSLSARLISLFERPFDRVGIDTRDDVSALSLGDEAIIQWPRYGYAGGVVGVVTLIRESVTGIHEIELWTDLPGAIGGGDFRALARRAPPRILTSIDALTITEGSAGILDVRLSSRPAGSRRVNISSDTNALTVHPQQLYFTPGDWGRAQQVLLVGVQDADADDATARVRLSGPGLANTATVSIALIDDDTLEEINTDLILSAPGVSVAEGGGSAVVMIQLRDQPPSARTVSVSSINQDISATPSELVFQPAAWNTPQALTITAASDADTDSELGIVNLRGDGINGAFISVFIGDTTIVNPDHDILVVSTLNPTLAEGGTLDLTVKLRAAPSADRSILIATTHPDITISRSGVTPASSITLPITTSNWASAKTITLAAIADADRLTEQFIVTLSGAEVNPVEIYGQLTDTQTAAGRIALEIGVAALNLTEGGSGTIPVALQSRPGAALTVRASVTNTDLSVTPAQRVFQPAAWDTAQNFTVAAKKDKDRQDDVGGVNFFGTGIERAFVGVRVTDQTAATVRATISMNQPPNTRHKSYRGALNPRDWKKNLSLTFSGTVTFSAPLAVDHQVIVNVKRSRRGGSWRLLLVMPAGMTTLNWITPMTSLEHGGPVETYTITAVLETVEGYELGTPSSIARSYTHNRND